MLWALRHHWPEYVMEATGLGACMAYAGGFAPLETDPAPRVAVSQFRSVEGNSERYRRRGVARVAVERDIYSAGHRWLLVNLSPVGAERTQASLTAEVQATIERRGEIQYSDVPKARSPLPLFTAWTTATPEGRETAWVTLTSNGVLEDEFLHLPATRRGEPK